MGAPRYGGPPSLFLLVSRPPQRAPHPRPQDAEAQHSARGIPLPPRMRSASPYPVRRRSQLQGGSARGGGDTTSRPRRRQARLPSWLALSPVPARRGGGGCRPRSPCLPASCPRPFPLAPSWPPAPRPSPPLDVGGASRGQQAAVGGGGTAAATAAAAAVAAAATKGGGRGKGGGGREGHTGRTRGAPYSDHRCAQPQPQKGRGAGGRRRGVPHRAEAKNAAATATRRPPAAAGRPPPPGRGQGKCAQHRPPGSRDC